jgi:hypothetical protein
MWSSTTGPNTAAMEPEAGKYQADSCLASNPVWKA